MKLNFTLIIILFFSFMLSAQEMETDSIVPVEAIAKDTLIEEPIVEETIVNPTEYTGYRIFLSHPLMIKEKKSYFKIKLKLTNTGSIPLTSDIQKEYAKKLIINSEGALEYLGKSSFEDLVYKKIRSKKLNIPSGASQDIELKINIPKDRRMEEGGFSLALGKGGGTKDYSRDLCPDLVLDSLVLVKRDRKKAYLTFQVRNIGKGAINIIGDVKDKNDNIAVGAFFSGTKKYSRGAVLGGQVYLTGLKESKGILFPGQSMKGKIKVSRKKQSKYTKVLIIVVDSSEIVIECNEGNNTDSVLLR